MKQDDKAIAFGTPVWLHVAVSLESRVTFKVRQSFSDIECKQ